MTPNDEYSGRTVPLTFKRCILYIYSTNIGTEYFKHGIHSPFFPLQNAVCSINLTYLVPVLFTFYIQGVLKIKKYNSGAKRLSVKFKWKNLVLHSSKYVFVVNPSFKSAVVVVDLSSKLRKSIIAGNSNELWSYYT